jgi:hypothetical protein
MGLIALFLIYLFHSNRFNLVGLIHFHPQWPSTRSPELACFLACCSQPSRSQFELLRWQSGFVAAYVSQAFFLAWRFQPTLLPNQISLGLSQFL